MLKVLTLSSLFPNMRAPNLGVFVNNQTRRLARSGAADVRVVAPLPVPPWPFSRVARYVWHDPSEEVDHGLHIYRPRYFTLPYLGWMGHDRWIAQACRPILAAARASGFAFDVIDGEFFWPCGVAAIHLGAEFGVPVSLKARGSDIHFWARHPVVGPKIMRAAAQARGLLCVSDSLRRDMIALGMAADKIRVHYTGIDLEMFKPGDKIAARRRLRVPSGPLVLSVGSLDPRKGHGLLIDAVARLEGVRLWIIGAGPQQARLQRQIDTLGLGGRVRLLGSIPYKDLPTYYNAADAFALCCVSEGLANVWVEAMACGVPVVTFAVDGAPEAIPQPDAGILIDPHQRTPAAVAEAIRACLDAPPATDTIRRCAERFGWSHNTTTLVEHLEACARPPVA